MSTTNSDLASASFSLPAAVPPLLAQDHQRVLDYTKQLFGGDSSVQLDVDPETSEQFFVVTAPAKGSVEELVALNHQWHCKLRSAVGDLADQYRLSIDPQ
jgi:hypothetical protein